MTKKGHFVGNPRRTNEHAHEFIEALVTSGRYQNASEVGAQRKLPCPPRRA